MQGDNQVEYLDEGEVTYCFNMAKLFIFLVQSPILLYEHL